MKIQCITYTQEGFVSSVGIKIDDDLILTTNKLLWLGKKESDRQVQLLNQFVDELAKLGVEVIK